MTVIIGTVVVSLPLIIRVGWGDFQKKDNCKSISLQIENKTLGSCTIYLDNKIMFLITFIFA